MPNVRARALLTIVFALAIGAGWEFFEWIFFKLNAAMMPTTYDDSMLDLVADTLGAVIVATVTVFRAPAESPSSRRERKLK